VHHPGGLVGVANGGRVHREKPLGKFDVHRRTLTEITSR
jgi:hypothetical protein